MIPKHILPILPEDDWKPLRGYGIVAGTWQGRDWIVQRRQLENLERWLVGQEIGRRVDTNSLLRGARSEVVLEEEGYFWTLQQRIPGRVFSISRESWAECWEVARGYLRDIEEAFATLQDISLSRETEPSRTVRFWKMKKEELFAEAEKVFSWSGIYDKFPEEVRGEGVTSHGDPILKNIVFGDRAYLIDWEMVSTLPRSADPLHFTSFALKYAPPEKWPEIVQECLPLASVSGLEEEEWLRGILWAVLRDFTAYPNGDHMLWQEGLGRLLREYDKRS